MERILRVAVAAIIITALVPSHSLAAPRTLKTVLTHEVIKSLSNYL